MGCLPEDYSAAEGYKSGHNPAFLEAGNKGGVFLVIHKLCGGNEKKKKKVEDSAMSNHGKPEQSISQLIENTGVKR